VKHERTEEAKVPGIDDRKYRPKAIDLRVISRDNRNDPAVGNEKCQKENSSAQGIVRRKMTRHFGGAVFESGN
jgi:hypothetical protein